ncbi:MAG TPA: helix-turn-helix domain-containing protein [Gemmatimonadaceae bacterium]|jgi:DNA-binding transcriptional MocR family regulator|nr:helix-turn-helix domain-containing protein [Gemmatimonadaceae bacterium]
MSVHVTSWVWSQKIGDPEAKLVLLKLADQSNDEGHCWPSRETIAEACETSVSTVKRRVAFLVELGVLEVRPRWRVGGLRSSNEYVIPYRRSTVDPAVGSARDPAVGPPTDPHVGPRRVTQEPSVEALLNHQRAPVEIDLDANREALRKLRSELGL